VSRRRGSAVLPSEPVSRLHPPADTIGTLSAINRGVALVPGVHYVIWRFRAVPAVCFTCPVGPAVAGLRTVELGRTDSVRDRFCRCESSGGSGCGLERDTGSVAPNIIVVPRPVGGDAAAVGCVLVHWQDGPGASAVGAGGNDL